VLEDTPTRIAFDRTPLLERCRQIGNSRVAVQLVCSGSLRQSASIRRPTTSWPSAWRTHTLQASNDSDEGKAMNRRIVIRIEPDIQSIVETVRSR